MTYFVAFDGSPLAESALLRARAFADLSETKLVAGLVVPDGNRRYAEEVEWLDADEEYDVETILARLHERVVQLAPSAAFEYDVVDRHAPRGLIARHLRKMAVDAGATVVFVGSENAGRIVSPISSIGGRITADERYDVHVVRHEVERPPRDKPDETHVPSEFFLP